MFVLSYVRFTSTRKVYYIIFSLFFWEDIIRYRKICRNSSDEDVKEFTGRVIEQYIMEGSKYQINIPDKMVKDIQMKFDSNNIEISIFDDAFDEITKIIRENCCSSFLLSKHAKMAKQVLDWLRGLEDLSVELQEAVKTKICEKRIINKNYAESFTHTVGSNNSKLTHESETSKRHLNAYFSVFSKEEEEIVNALSKLETYKPLSGKSLCKGVSIVKGVSNIVKSSRAKDDSYYKKILSSRLNTPTKNIKMSISSTLSPSQTSGK